jgi:CheY-like chemotaxis protein
LIAEALDAIERAARQGSDLTRRLLTLGRPEIHAPRVLALGHAARELGVSLRRLLPEHIELQVEIRDTPSVLFDPAQLDQVLLNLCVNAKDAMPRGGSMQIGLESTSTSDLTARTGRSLEGLGWAHLWVTDSGAGMAADVVERIFEPFFTTKGEHGTGLGLAAVRAIVQQNGGFVEVESEPGRGATFHVYLPETTDAPTSTSLPVSSPHTVEEAVVLLAEDDIDVRAALARALSRSGFTVLQCGDAESAREILAQRRTNVDILCTDGIMPGGGTGTLIDEYLGAYPAGKVIMCSGYVQDEVRVRETQSESISFLPKPFAPSDLIERIRVMCDDRAPASR